LTMVTEIQEKLLRYLKAGMSPEGAFNRMRIEFPNATFGEFHAATKALADKQARDAAERRFRNGPSRDIGETSSKQERRDRVARAAEATPHINGATKLSSSRAVASVEPAARQQAKDGRRSRGAELEALAGQPAEEKRESLSNAKAEKLPSVPRAVQTGLGLLSIVETAIRSGAPSHITFKEALDYLAARAGKGVPPRLRLAFGRLGRRARGLLRAPRSA
jgi:hypothetical protein